MIRYNLIIILLLLIPTSLAVDATVTVVNQSNGTMTRTFDKTWYLPNDIITVSLLGTGANFTFWSATETIPENFNITLHSSQFNITALSDNTFIGLSDTAFNTPIYQLTHSPTATTDQWYNINGTFMDADRNNGTIEGITTKSFYIMSNSTSQITILDLSNNNRLEKPEVMGAVIEYFNNGTPDFTTSVRMVNLYMQNAPILPSP